jgi:RNA polymerase sigma-70 factor (family 1)
LKPFKNHTDEELLSLIKQDDEQAFTALFERHSKRMASLAYGKVNSLEITQEIVQDIFATIWERRHSLSIHAFSSYLAVCVKYQAIGHLRSQIASKKHTNLFKAFVKICEEDTLQKVELHDLEDALEKGVHQLPDKTQLVFRLNRFEGKSISEIADRLHLSEKAIKYHLSKSVRELRVHLRHFLVSCLLLMLFWWKSLCPFILHSPTIAGGVTETGESDANGTKKRCGDNTDRRQSIAPVIDAVLVEISINTKTSFSTPLFS